MTARDDNGNGVVTLMSLARMKRSGEKFASITAYDAAFGRLADEAGIEVILVGDSLGMVVQGRETTVPVTMDDMVYHTRMVSRGASRSLVIADLPFLSYGTAEAALANAARLMQQGHARMVKLEGGTEFIHIVRLLAGNGVPVCGHLGLLPQSIHKLGGYRVQGREEAAARRIIDEAKALQEAGVDMLVVECVPAELGGRISEAVDIPVIGIGAGPNCDGQILVLYDILGITPGRTPKFARNFMADAGTIQQALETYSRTVRDRSFPAAEHCF